MQYQAFISYSHSEEKWASWILGALEGFCIPKRLVAAFQTLAEARGC